MTHKNEQAKYISTWLKRFDKDIAQQFILSGLSLNNRKIVEAFEFACKLMEYRVIEENKNNKNNNANPSIQDLEKLLTNILGPLPEKPVEIPISKTEERKYKTDKKCKEDCEDCSCKKDKNNSGK